MMSLVMLLVTAVALLLVFGWLLVRHQSNPFAGSQATVELPDFIVLPGVNFPIPEKLFDRREIEIVASAPDLHAVAKELVRDREEMARAWLAALQKDVFTLWRFRRLLTTCGIATSALGEIEIAASSLGFLLQILLLRVAVRLLGAFAMARFSKALCNRMESTRSLYASLLRRLPLERQIEVEHRWLKTAPL